MRRALRTSGRTLPLLLAIGLLAAVAAACSSSSSSKTTPTIEVQTPASSPSSAASATAPAGSATSGSTEAANVDIAAKDNKFDKNTITVKAGQKVTVTLDNQDKIPHNFSVFTTKGGTALYTGDYINGGDKKSMTFTAPAKPGNYYFECEIHPETMNGAFVVQ